MAKVRVPTQKRSIEKRDKILKAGYKLFCENGYHETTTNDICESANISTGVLYSYFVDKKDIFITSFQKFLVEKIEALVSTLSDDTQKFNLDTFISNTINVFTQIYKESSNGISELSNMMNKDEDIFKAFCDLEEKYLSVIVSMLNQNAIKVSTEKLYLVYAIIDAIAQENNIEAHSEIDKSVLLAEGISSVKNILG